MGLDMDRHHSLPTSRGGTDADIVHWDKRFHRMWHTMFRNMTVEEVCDFIREISKPGGHWTKMRLSARIAEIIGDNDGKSKRYYYPRRK